jgi:hypothetical protein
MAPVLAIDFTRTSNARLITDVHTLGYLKDDDDVLDVTYGLGAFWREWRPRSLVAHDIDPDLAPDGVADFTAIPHGDYSFDVAVFDPPYKLNGTPGHASDDRYGVGGEAYTPTTVRLTAIYDGCREAARVARRIVLVKVMDQVVSGHVRWVADEVTVVMAEVGMVKLDRLELVGYREQPGNRRQVHARRNTSSLLVFGRARARKVKPEPEWDQLSIDDVLEMT